MGNEQGKVDGSSGMPPGMQTMGRQLQRRFAKGVQYDMKILIKGDRNTGKTCLFKRLQGSGFIEEYMPTKEIQIASIQWNYRATDDIVKVDIWDVVDKGHKKKPGAGLKMSHDEMDGSMPPEGIVALDAEFLNVYKNAHGVVMLMDITKQWTWQYVQKELPTVPSHIPILVLANFRDMGEHRVVGEEEVQYFIDALRREDKNRAEIRYAEASMKNGFGLRYLYKFLNVPFLRLQRQTFIRQLETNKEETKTTLEELTFMLETEEQNYDQFLAMLETRRKQAKASQQIAASSTLSPTTPDTPATPATGNQASTSSEKTPQSSSTGDKVKEVVTGGGGGGSREGAGKEEQQQESTTTTQSQTPEQPKKSSFGSRLLAKFRFKEKDSQGTSKQAESPKSPRSQAGAIPGVRSVVKAVNVDEFVPEETLDASFFGGPDDDDDDDERAAESRPAIDPKEEDDDESTDEENPMVAGDEDVDFDDTDLAMDTEKRTSSAGRVGGGGDIVVSSDEDDRSVVAVAVDVTDSAVSGLAPAPKEVEDDEEEEEEKEKKPKTTKKKPRRKAVAATIVVTSSSEDDRPVVANEEEEMGSAVAAVRDDKTSQKKKKKKDKEKKGSTSAAAAENDEATTQPLDLLAPLPSGLDAWLDSMSSAVPSNLPDPVFPAGDGGGAALNSSESKRTKKKSESTAAADSPDRKKKKKKKHATGHREKSQEDVDQGEKKTKKKHHRSKKDKGEGGGGGQSYELI